jgi:uncharacterized protein (TIGR02301 family)
MQRNARQHNLKAQLSALVLAVSVAFSSAAAQAPQSDVKPYDDRLVRLAEILGSVHFLRELCGGNDGQFWRVRMQSLMDAEGSSALRRARLARSFNIGYNNFSRTYSSCTTSAQQAITRFLTEGAEIADQLVKTVP